MTPPPRAPLLAVIEPRQPIYRDDRDHVSFRPRASVAAFHDGNEPEEPSRSDGVPHRRPRHPGDRCDPIERKLAPSVPTNLCGDHREGSRLCWREPRGELGRKPPTRHPRTTAPDRLFPVMTSTMRASQAAYELRGRPIAILRCLIPKRGSLGFHSRANGLCVDFVQVTFGERAPDEAGNIIDPRPRSCGGDGCVELLSEHSEPLRQGRQSHRSPIAKTSVLALTPPGERETFATARRRKPRIGFRPSTFQRRGPNHFGHDGTTYRPGDSDRSRQRRPDRPVASTDR